MKEDSVDRDTHEAGENAVGAEAAVLDDERGCHRPENLDGLVAAGEASAAPSTSNPDLVVDSGNLPATAREIRDLLASDGNFFGRGVPVKVVPAPGGRPPRALPLTAHRVVAEAHRLRRPVSLRQGECVPVTLPDRVAHMYLHMEGEWNLPPLSGICTAPLLSADGSVRTVEGYDPATHLWCANLPTLPIPDRPSRAQAVAALLRLREEFRTFPFADSPRQTAPNGVEVVNLDHAPGYDESTFLVALMTAICRPSLWLAPGLLIRAPEISGAGTGKGLLVRSICSIAFGVRPRAFTTGGNRQELDKRLASDLVDAAPVLFLDNANGVALRSDTLAAVLTERPVRVRLLGRTGMVELNSTAFIAVTGNGITLSEDLARRFLVSQLDARCEDPEQRRFGAGFFQQIERRRAELLVAALTIWRWGRQNAADLNPGRPLGSYEQWCEWCRDPLLALGCADPVERIESMKADDPHRRQIVEIFEVWNEHHGELPIVAVNLAAPVRVLIDPQGRGRQFIAARLTKLAGTRVGGFELSRQEPAGKWGVATYALRRTPPGRP